MTSNILDIFWPCLPHKIFDLSHYKECNVIYERSSRPFQAFQSQSSVLNFSRTSCTRIIRLLCSFRRHSTSMNLMLTENNNSTFSCTDFPKAITEQHERPDSPLFLFCSLNDHLPCNSIKKRKRNWANMCCCCCCCCCSCCCFCCCKALKQY